MKAKLVSALGLLLIFILLSANVQGFGGAISPPKIYVKVNASKGLPQDASAVIRIRNTNDFPVKIQLIPRGDIAGKYVEVSFSKNNFTLPPHTDDQVKVNFKVKRLGTYNGTIITRFSLLGNGSSSGATMKPSIALSSDVRIDVVGKPSGLLGIPGFELILAVIAVAAAAAIKRRH